MSESGRRLYHYLSFVIGPGTELELACLLVEREQRRVDLA